MTQDTTTKELYRRLLQYIKPYWKTVILMLIALFVTAAMTPLMPALLKFLVDDSIIEKDMSAIVMVPFLLVLIFTVKGVSGYFSKVLSEFVAQKAILDIRKEMFQKLNKLPLEIHQHYTSGNIISKLTYDVAQVSTTLSEAWVVIIRDGLIIIGLLIFLFYTSWQLTLIIILIAPVLGFIVGKAGKRMRGSSSEMQASMGDMTKALEETLSAHKDIKTYGTEDHETNKFQKISESFRLQTMAVVKVSAINTPLVQVLASISLAGVLYIASLMSAEGLFTPGELIAFIVAAAMIFGPVRRLTSINEAIQRGMAGAVSIFELLDQAEESNLGKNIITNAKGAISFKQVSFQYQTMKTPVLSNLSFTVKSQTTVALVGESGSGKTTIANLISRLLEITAGEILLDDINTKEIELSNLRSHIAHVSQDVVLFNDSIKANISYGLTDFSDDRIIKATKDAHAWGFIEKLPQGLETNIGDNGSKLSGGQRQRIAIARAFLKNAPILILDEATSALDNESETQVQKALEKLRKNRTVIIIAHRLSTIESADTIIVLQKGKIIEQGSHQNLIQKDGYYKSLHRQGLNI